MLHTNVKQRTNPGALCDITNQKLVFPVINTENGVSENLQPGKSFSKKVLRFSTAVACRQKAKMHRKMYVFKNIRVHVDEA